MMLKMKYFKSSCREHLAAGELILSSTSCINYTRIIICMRIQFSLPGKARQTFVDFSSDFHPN